jgi:DNA processing protein
MPDTGAETRWADRRAHGAAAHAHARDGAACRACLRRSWLLSVLGTRLDYRARDESRLLALLELEDEQLIDAIAGRRAGEIRPHWERFGSTEAAAAICRHCNGWPGELGAYAGAPRALYLTGAVERLRALSARPTVAIVGSPGASDYGLEIARSLGRGLAASGVTVVGGFVAGIGAAAHAGALEAGGGSIAVMSGGVDVCRPASRRELYARVKDRGCALAELPRGGRVRRWCRLARARTVAGLAQLTIVVEAGEGPGELSEAHVAQMLGRTVAAVPGRVTSPLSRGTCALLIEGKPAVRGAADALELLYGRGTEQASSAQRSELALLEPRLRTLLEQVGSGRDTLGKLTANVAADASDTLLGLAELELKGLLARGDGGRYIPRQSLAGGA